MDIVCNIRLKSADDFLRIARQFRKVNDVILVHENDRGTREYTITLAKTHLMQLPLHFDSPDRQRVEDALKDLGFAIMPAEIQFFRPDICGL